MPIQQALFNCIIEHGLQGVDALVIQENIDYLLTICHAMSVRKQWWKKEQNFGEKIALAHSELSEALEGHRKNLQDDKLPQYKMTGVELADCIIRVLDTAGGFGYTDLGEMMAMKLLYNEVREDHKIENRMKDGGKAY